MGFDVKKIFLVFKVGFDICYLVLGKFLVFLFDWVVRGLKERMDVNV